MGNLASYVGAPLATDTMTANRSRMEYARLLVEVNPINTLPTSIPIVGPLGSYDQKIIYEWKTMKCSKCNLVGHASEKCRRRDRKVQGQQQGNNNTSPAPTENANVLNPVVVQEVPADKQKQVGTTSGTNQVQKCDDIRKHELPQRIKDSVANSSVVGGGKVDVQKSAGMSNSNSVAGNTRGASLVISNG